MRDVLARLGEGSYFNEPAEDLEDWKVQFGGGRQQLQPPAGRQAQVGPGQLLLVPQLRRLR